MTVRDFIIYIAQSPDIDTEIGSFDPQTVLILKDGKYYDLKSVFVREDNKLILEVNK